MGWDGMHHRAMKHAEFNVDGICLSVFKFFIVGIIRIISTRQTNFSRRKSEFQIFVFQHMHTSLTLSSHFPSHFPQTITRPDLSFFSFFDSLRAAVFFLSRHYRMISFQPRVGGLKSRRTIPYHSSPFISLSSPQLTSAHLTSSSTSGLLDFDFDFDFDSKKIFL